MNLRSLVGMGASAAIVAGVFGAQSAFADTYNVTVTPATQTVAGTGGTTTVTVTGQSSPGSALPSQPVLANLLVSTTGTATNFGGIPFTLSVQVTDATTGVAAVAQNETVTFGATSNANGTANSSFFTAPTFSGPLTFTFGTGPTATFANISSFTFVAPNASSGGSGSIGSTLTAGAAAPEPGSLLLVIPGALGVVGMIRRRKTA